MTEKVLFQLSFLADVCTLDFVLEESCLCEKEDLLDGYIILLAILS